MTPVVIMCGGKGLRLHPLTSHTPKPMLNVGGRPIIEQIMRRFASQGFKHFWLCVNYKKELIKDYFGNGEDFGWKVKYAEETKPLGTAGALGLLPDFKVPFIVTNGDVIADIQYGDLMENHARSGKDATICLGLYQHQVPFGVADFEDDEFVGLREKPIENFSVNAGIYVLEPKVREKIYPKKALDMPTLLEKFECGAYPIEGYWNDVGTFEQYAAANAEWNEDIGADPGPRRLQTVAS